MYTLIVVPPAGRATVAAGLSVAALRRELSTVPRDGSRQVFVFRCAPVVLEDDGAMIEDGQRVPLAPDPPPAAPAPDYRWGRPPGPDPLPD